jgi:L-2-hydroxyglutarate oxidase LhgO
MDSYGFMRSFYGRAQEQSAAFVFNSEVVGIDKVADGYRVSVSDREGMSSVVARVVVNAAGLFSDKVASLAGIDIDKAGYRLHYCKGKYYCLSPRLGRPVDRLVYPVPEQAGIGIHISLSLDGRVRLGPNFRYMDTIDYSIDDTDRMDFYRAAHRYLPIVELDDLIPDSSGVRPKLQGPGEGFHDFVIVDENKRGLPGFINLVGIESPGLTASPAIARYVAGMVDKYLT